MMMGLGKRSALPPLFEYGGKQSTLYKPQNHYKVKSHKKHSNEHLIVNIFLEKLINYMIIFLISFEINEYILV